MIKTITFMLKNESAATAVEYALLLAMIVIVFAAAVLGTGGASGATFGASTGALESALK